MKTTAQIIDPEVGSESAVKTAATALELNRLRLHEELAADDRSGRSRSLPRGALGLLMHGLAGANFRATLGPVAERHPFGVIAAGVAIGGLAYLALPRLATGLVVPILWSEGRQVAQDLLHGWLRSTSGRTSGA
jgi:hypothetical protein